VGHASTDHHGNHGTSAFEDTVAKPVSPMWPTVCTATICETVRVHPIKPALEDRRHAVPPERELKNHGIGPKQLTLFLRDIRSLSTRGKGLAGGFGVFQYSIPGSLGKVVRISDCLPPHGVEIGDNDLVAGGL
jgi:hypothetical protein